MSDEAQAAAEAEAKAKADLEIAAKAEADAKAKAEANQIPLKTETEKLVPTTPEGYEDRMGGLEKGLTELRDSMNDPKNKGVYFAPIIFYAL